MHVQYKVDPDEALRPPSFGRLYGLTAMVGLLVLADVIFWWLGYESARNPGGVNLALIAAVIGGARIIYGALSSLLEGDWGADLALAVALLASLALKEYWVGAEVVLIAMVGESLEALTFARTHRELSRILDLRPWQVRVRREGNNGAEVEIPAADVRVDDIVIIRPGERVPVDGIVVTGRSAIDQSTLTGESLPVDKDVGDRVHAGTMNQFGALDVRATAVGDETTLGQVIQLVVEAQQHKSRIERTADQLARYFLPMVLIAAAVTFLFTNSSALAAFRTGLPANWVWMPTLAVLVVTCPCALILATPAATMAALAWLAKRGVLIRGGVALERLAAVTRIAFDKTGTLTTGQLRLGDIFTLGDHSTESILRWAISAEQRSEHLVAKALLKAGQERQVAPLAIEEFRALPGTGVCATLGGSHNTLVVGNRRLLEHQGIELTSETNAALDRLDTAGQTPLLVAVDGHVVGAIGVHDTVRPEAASVVRALRDLDVRDLVILTGDRAAVAAQVARTVGVERFDAELRPEDKARFIAAWKSEPRVVNGRAARHVVAMVGDGVNDAPALAIADVGVAVASVGSDLAAEAADLILLGEPLATLPDLCRLARATQRVIRQNILLFAFFVNVLGIILTAWIMPRWSPVWLERSPVAAALFHQIGSVLVLLNSMRLLWFQRWQASWLGRAEDSLAETWDNLADSFSPWGDFTRAMWQRRRQLLQGSALLAVVVYALSGLTIVALDEVAVVRRFGGYHATLPPGLHLRLPAPWETIAREQPERVRTLLIGLPPSSESAQRNRADGNSATRDRTPIEWNTTHDVTAAAKPSEEILLTGDESLVELAATIQYRLSDVRAWHFAVRDPERVLRGVAEGVLRETIATQPLLNNSNQSPDRPEILTTARSDLQRTIRDRLQQWLDSLSLGAEILPDGVCLEDVHPPLAVVGAFRDVSSAFKEQERMRNEADAVRRDLLIKAGGEAAWRQLERSNQEVTGEMWTALRPELSGTAAALVDNAQAYSITQQASAAGKAESFLLMNRAAQSDPNLVAWRLYMNALGESLAKKKKLIIDNPAGARRQLWLGTPSVQPPLALPPLERPEPEG